MKEEEISKRSVSIFLTPKIVKNGDSEFSCLIIFSLFYNLSWLEIYGQ